MNIKIKIVNEHRRFIVLMAPPFGYKLEVGCGRSLIHSWKEVTSWTSTKFLAFSQTIFPL
jgi:hypothetical protein